MKALSPGTDSLSRAGRKQSGSSAFRIVGLGASAGGLEAFEQFFRALPADTGMGFVLVPHLDPEHESLLTAILQRSTIMSVVEAADQMPVRPNCVYVIPPNRDIALFHGILQLSLPAQPHGHRMPIDSFLRSLAEDQGERAIGVILSGTGSDGTQGLRAIVGAGGVSFAQEPATAKFNGMPASAIKSGYATYVMPVEQMPAAMLAVARDLPVRKKAQLPPVSDLNRILMLLRSGTGHDFSQYKKTTISRRIERRMVLQSIADTDIYARYLKENPAEVQLLFKELLINVTSFFRDPEAFAILKTEVLPKLFETRPRTDDVLRVWVAGCATGEEAYSIAIILQEFMAESQRDFRVQIYSTDLDEDAIVVARAGIYPFNIAQDVSQDRLQRFFLKLDNGYQIKKSVRGMVVFAIQNVLKDPPFTKLDMISCRNLMIYLEPAMQTLLIPTFHYALKPGGILLLSPSESIDSHNSDIFTPLSRKWKIYQAANSPASVRTVMLSSLSHTAVNRGGSEETMKKVKETNFAELTKQVLLQSYAPASVVTDLSGGILYVHGDTSKYLRPAPGQATLNVLEMARDGLQLDLRAALHNAASQGTPTTSRELSIKVHGSSELMSFSVSRMPDPDGGEGLLLISFHDVQQTRNRKPARGKRAMASVDFQRVAEVELELNRTRENLQAIIEEQQASNEELKSANEEMQSTNEELQSINEELETSKEELQSLNEELANVNAELNVKIEELSDIQNDMKNLFDNMSTGTIFLDQKFLVRRFTREAAKVYRLVASDVGRQLSDIKCDLEGVDIVAQARMVLETLMPWEREVRTTNGVWYQARIQPYRTLENVIDGLVLTLSDINKRVEAELAVQEGRELAEAIVDTVREPLMILDGDLRVVTASRSFYEQFQTSTASTVGRLIYELGAGQWNTPKLRELLERVLPQNESFDDLAMEYELSRNERRTILLNARRIIRRANGEPLILLAIEVRAPIEKEGLYEREEGDTGTAQLTAAR